MLVKTNACATDHSDKARMWRSFDPCASLLEALLHAAPSFNSLDPSNNICAETQNQLTSADEFASATKKSTQPRLQFFQ
jgi:hypothetical protein